MSGERCRDAQQWQSGELLKLRLLGCVCDQQPPLGQRRQPVLRPASRPQEDEFLPHVKLRSPLCVGLLVL
jgi:hypothetical protein